MRGPNLFVAIMLAVVLVAPACAPPGDGGGAGSGPATMALDEERGFQEEFGPYDIVENWAKGLPDEDDGVTHAGWTWGSQAAVYAETPDRIWYAQRGELPLPEGAEDWTPFSLLDPPLRTTGGTDGSCEGEPPTRGWERRMHHVVFVVDGDGNFVESWTNQDSLFDDNCSRGPHKIKMSPYDPDKHVWVVDDELHQIFKFTYDGELVMSLGTRLEPGRGRGEQLRPSDRHRLVARWDVLYQRRIRRRTRGQVRRRGQLHQGLGDGACRSRQSGSQRVRYGAQRCGQCGSPGVRGGSW